MLYEVITKLLKTGFNITGASIESGAATSVYLADSEEVKDTTGKYFINKKEESTSLLSQDDSLVSYFWELSEKFTGL